MVCGSPNCVASAMDVKGARHIFLIAATQLAPGEELTYAPPLNVHVLAV